MLKQGAWRHVVVVADTVRRTLRLYVNGSEQDLADLPQPPTAVKLVRQVIGREFDGRRPARYFHGAIDDVRFYDGALSAEDIRALCPQAVPLPGRDPRNIRTGCVIPDEGYCDQPYVVVTRDGRWLCTLTTAAGSEGANDSHVVATISADQGRTWSEPVPIEPADGPDAVYIMPLVTPGGRVYGFYNYNGDNFRCPGRSDCVGWFVFKRISVPCVQPRRRPQLDHAAVRRLHARRPQNEEPAGLPALSSGRLLLDSRDESGRGLALTTCAQGALRIDAFDGETRAAWESDPELLTAGQRCGQGPSGGGRPAPPPLQPPAANLGSRGPLPRRPGLTALGHRADGKLRRKKLTEKWSER